MGLASRRHPDRADHVHVGEGQSPAAKESRARRRAARADFEEIGTKSPDIVPGTAVFLTGNPQGTPTALLHSLKHYNVLHERNVILNVVTAPSPTVRKSDRMRIEPINERFVQVTLTFGYMERPNVPRTLAIFKAAGWRFEPRCEIAERK